MKSIPITYKSFYKQILYVRLPGVSLNQTPVLALNIEFHDNITGHTLALMKGTAVLLQKACKQNMSINASKMLAALKQIAQL